jgi:hypothetical protein
MRGEYYSLTSVLPCINGFGKIPIRSEKASSLYLPFCD